MRKTRRHKYGAKKTEYNGVKYDSKKEAMRARELDQLVQAGKVASWDRQIRVPLHAGNDEVVGHYVVDFVVYRPDRTQYYEEVKGYETQLWKWKFKHFQKEYPDKEIRVI